MAERVRMTVTIVAGPDETFTEQAAAGLVGQRFTVRMMDRPLPATVRSAELLANGRLRVTAELD
jgi:hypothetical protein